MSFAALARQERNRQLDIRAATVRPVAIDNSWLVEEMLRRHDPERDPYLAALAWELHEDALYILRQSTWQQVQALVRVFERRGARPFNPDTRLAELPSADVLSVAHHLWAGGAMHSNRAAMVWVMRVLANSGVVPMTAKEIEMWQTLPDPVVLYRGFTAFHFQNPTPADLNAMARGHSWSTSRDHAATYGRPTIVQAGYLASVVAPKPLISFAQARSYGLECAVIDPDRLGQITIERALDELATEAA